MNSLINSPLECVDGVNNMKKKIIIGVAILVLLIVTSGILSIQLANAAEPTPRKVGSEKVVYTGYLNGNHITVWKVRTSDFRTLYITTGNNGNISVIQPK